MMLFYGLLLTPIFAMLFFMALPQKKLSGKWHSFFLFILLVLSILLCFCPQASKSWHNLFQLDALNLPLILLTSFIAFSIAIFSNSYMQAQLKQCRLTLSRYRYYFILYYLFILTLLISLSTNHMGILWIAMEGATLSTAMLVSLYRTPHAIEAAWKYFVLCIVGIALALFGIIWIYFAAQSIGLGDQEALLFTTLYQHASELDPQVLRLAFVFLFIGYGTKLGLAPMHFWLPDAYTESPAPVSALLSGLFLNTGLYALIKFKLLMPFVLINHLMMGFGVLSMLIGSVLIYRQKNIKRLFSYSSIQHLGFILIALSLPNQQAIFAVLIYMLAHALIKSSVFLAIGNITLRYGTQQLEQIRGVFEENPSMGISLILCMIGLLGLPPFALFISECLIILNAIESHWGLAFCMVLASIIAIAGMLRNLHPVLYGKSNALTHTSPICTFPIFLSLSVAILIGIYLPSPIATLLHQASERLAL